MEKYCRAGRDPDDNMEHALCMLCTTVYKLTLRICNTYCFSTATMVTRTLLSVTSCVRCLSCSVNPCVSLVCPPGHPTKIYYGFIVSHKYYGIYGPGRLAGIVTGYGLDGPGIESLWGRDFPHLSRPVSWPTQTPVQWVPGLSRG